ncbi:MAG: hypothetical protein ABIG70_03125 [Pseudomonadota bacterium]
MKKMLFAISCLMLSGTTQAAMSGSEFMKAELMPQIAETKECVHRYVQYGYKKVPNEHQLKNKMEEVIRRDGLGSRGTGIICDIAAKELGMER